jgi:F-box and leucine-rich repeat protein 10/11
LSNGVSSADQLEDGHPLSDGLTEIAMAALGAGAADNDLDPDEEMPDVPPLDPALDNLPHQDTAVSSIEDHYVGADQNQDLRLLTALDESAVQDEDEPDHELHFPGQANGVAEPEIPLRSPLTDLATSPTVKTESNGIKSEPGSAKAVRHSSRASKVPERFSTEQDHHSNQILQTPRPGSRGKSLDMVPSSAKKKSPMPKHRKETPKQEKKAVVASSSPKSKQELEEEASRKLARELQELEFGLRRRSK